MTWPEIPVKEKIARGSVGVFNLQGFSLPSCTHRFKVVLGHRFLWDAHRGCPFHGAIRVNTAPEERRHVATGVSPWSPWESRRSEPRRGDGDVATTGYWCQFSVAPPGLMRSRRFVHGLTPVAKRPRPCRGWSGPTWRTKHTEVLEDTCTRGFSYLGLPTSRYR